MRISTVLTAVLIGTVLVFSSVASFNIPSPAIASQPANGPRFGWWMDEGNLWSGGACGNTPSSYYNPQGFFNNYFLTSPYPAAIQWTTTLAPTGACSPGASGEISLLSGIAQIANGYPNIKIIILFFVSYLGPWNNQGTVINQNQLNTFDSLLSSLKGDSSIEGIQPEFEYLQDQNGNACGLSCVTPAAISAFNNAVTSYGLTPIAYNIGDPSSAPLTFNYDGYPYCSQPCGPQYDTLGAPNSIGIGYGLTGPPSTGPIWTQSVINNIVDNSPSGSQFVMAYSIADTNSPCAGYVALWMCPTLRGWVASAPGYSNYLTANGQSPPTTSTTSTTASSTTTSSASSSTTSTASTGTTTSPTTTATSASVSSTTTSSSPYPYIYVQSSLGFVLGTNVSVTSLSVNKAASTVTFTAPHVSFEFFMPPAYTLLRILDNGNDVTAKAQVQTNSTGTLYLVQGSSNWEIDYSQTGSTTTTSSTSSTVTSTTSTSSATTSSATSTGTVSSSSSSSTSQTSWQTPIETSTFTPVSQDYSLAIIGGCPSSGSGVYSPGSIAVVQVMGVCDRTRDSGLRVVSWSLDGGTNTPVLTNGTYTLSVTMNAPHTVSFYTVKQYPLTLDFGAQNTLLSMTPPTIPGDNHWYDSGMVVTFVGSVTIQGYTVAGWELDGGVPNLISGAPDLTTSFVMNGSHSLTVLLVPVTNSCAAGSCLGSQTFFVAVQTDTGSPGGVWIDGAYYPKSVTFAWQAGTGHNITAALGMRQSSVRTQFAGWSGLSGSMSRTVNLTVNASGSLTAHYTKRYLVTLSFTDAVGETLAPQTVTLKGPSGTQTLGANMSVWADSGAPYLITSATWMNWNVIMSNDSSFSVIQPAALRFPLSVYPQTIKATDVYNLPLRGASVNVTTLNGVEMSIVTDSQGMAVFRVPIGLFSATVNYLGVSNQVVAQSNGSHSYTVSFLLSYPLVATIGAASAVALAFAILRLRRHDAKGVYAFSDSD